METITIKTNHVIIETSKPNEGIEITYSTRSYRPHIMIKSEYESDKFELEFDIYDITDLLDQIDIVDIKNYVKDKGNT
jgi:hypothetical protein